MKRSVRILSLALIFLLLVACSGTERVGAAPTPEQTAEAPALTPSAAPEDMIPIVPTETPVSSLPPSPTEEPTPEPTPEPTAEPTPEPTPEPARTPAEGDIAVNFPDYDTGVDADYSYQSDELRIAITVHRETLRDEKQDQDLMETYYVADIWVRNIRSMRTAFACGEFNTRSEEGDALARRENAIFAVNGSMNQGLVIKDGQVLQGLRQNKGWNSGAVGILYRDGTMKTFYLENEPLDPDREIKNGALYGWQFGPIIIRDHEPGPGATRYHGMGYKARNMLGVYEPGHYVIVTCDNRGEDARGMNELMMVDIMKSLGVKDAFNLDGGTSAVMVFMGKVINRPTLRNDNGTMVEGRPLLDMLIFGECGEDGSFRDLSTLTPSKTKD